MYFEIGSDGQPLALFVEDHHGHAGDRLGHGVVAEDRVLRHRRAAGHVALAVGAVIHDLAVARQDGDHAGELLLVDCLLHQRVQALEPLGRKAHRLWLDWRHVDHRPRCLLKMSGGRGSILCLGVQSGGGKNRPSDNENADKASRSRFHLVFLHFAARIHGQLRRSLYTSLCERRQLRKIRMPKKGTWNDRLSAGVRNLKGCFLGMDFAGA